MTLTSNLQTNSGGALDKAKVWTFRAAAGTGLASFGGSSSNFGTGSDNTWDLALADVEGDGDLDVALAHSGGGQNTYYLNNGAGSFGSGTNFAGGDTRSVAFADVDGDGDADLAVGNFSQQDIVLLNDGDGTFDTTTKNVGTSTDNTASLRFADIDGDGDLDMLSGAGNSGSGVQNVAYKNDGAGNFNAGTSNFGTSTQTTQGIDVGDLDNDGDIDVVTGNLNQQNVAYINSGSGSFGSSVNFGTGSDYTQGVALVDIDNDGDLDIAVGNSTNPGDNAVFLNNGSGTSFASSVSFGSASYSTQQVNFGDVNGDGYLDVVPAHNTTQNFVYLNNGSGTSFASSVSYGTGSDASYAVKPADVNGDGALDLVVGNSSSAQNVVYFNASAVTVSSTSPTAAFASAPSTGNVTATFSVAVTAGDAASFVVHGSMRGKKAGAYSGNNTTTLTFNPTNDFFPGETVFSTLVSTIQDANGNSLSKGYVWSFAVQAAVGPGDFTAAFSTFGTGNDVTAGTALGDVDGDGDLDLALANQGGQSLVQLNSGTGRFDGGFRYYGGASDAKRKVELVDVDGDGDLDVATAHRPGQNVVNLNDGAGNFATNSNFGTGSDDTYSIAFGDLNGDGFADVAVGNQAQQNVAYINNGSGVLTANSANFGTGSDATYSVRLADVDNDGDLDVAVGNISAQNIVYFNNNAGVFSGSSNFGTGSDATHWVEFADGDGDGDVDVAVGNYAGQDAVYLNDGAGNFNAGTKNFGTGTDNTEYLIFADAEGDGDLDVAAGHWGQTDVVYVNDGAGNFSAGSNIGAGNENTWVISSGDVDGDGDLDLAVGVTGQNAVYYNALAPTISSVSPTEHAIAAAKTSNISATFSEAMSAGTALNFIVYGGQTGARAGVYSGDGTSTLTFDPTNDFEPGELVEVVFTGGQTVGIRSDVGAGAPLASGGYIYQFYAAAGVGPAAFTTVFSNFGSSTTTTRSAVLGDADGDGDLDVAVAHLSMQNYVRLNDGSGNFDSGSKNFGTGSDLTLAAVFADVDGDGDLDVAAGNNGAQNAVELNDGAGNFTAGTKNFGSGADATSDNAVAFGDVDGDGDLDVAVGNVSEQNVVYLNDGVGNFTDGARNFGGGSSTTRGVALGDVDGDGDLDVAAVNLGSGSGEQNVAYLNDGLGNFTAGTKNIGPGTDKSWDLVLGDVDGDGDLDAAVANCCSQQSAVELNDGAGNFTAGTKNYGGASESNLGIALADVDGDGDLDAVAAKQSQQNAAYLNDGSGNFTAGTKNFGTGSDNTQEVAVGDVDGDGDLDLVAANENEQDIVYFNSAAPVVNNTSPAAAFASAPSTGNVTATFSIAVTAGDAASFVVHGSMRGKKAGAYSGNNTTTLTFNPTNDFFPGETVFSTLVSTIQDANGNSLSKGYVWGFTVQAAVGPADFTSVFSSYGSSGAATWSSALADVDGDGDLDVAAGNLGAQNAVYLNDGAGALTAGVKNFGTSSDNTQMIAFADVDGDGDLDAAAGNKSSEQNAIYLNDGAGNFNAGTNNFGSGSDETWAVAFGDLNGDGDLDVAVGNLSAQNAVYFNDGAGGYTAGTANFGTGSEQTENIVLGDVDNDGDLDLAVGNYAQQNVVYKNDGLGDFSSGSVNFGGASDNTQGLDIGDVDNDGDLDLASGNYTQQNTVELNDGAGAFTAGTKNFGTGSDATSFGLKLADMDGDGDLDAVVGNGGAQNAVYLNDASGNFNAGTKNFGTGSGSTVSVAAGDLDGDGDLDLIEGDSVGQNSAHFNSSAPVVNSTSPTAAFASAPSTGNVTATFSVAVTAGDAASFVVHGSMRGKKVGAYSGNNSTTLTFNPTNDFFPGETVFSTLVSTIQDASGNSLSKGYVWGFTVDAAVGPAVFNNITSDIDTPTNSTRSLALGDLDSDGDLDVVTGNNSTQANRVYLSNGNGTFATGNDVDTPTNNTMSISLGDLDGDGDLDLATGNQNQVNRVYLSNGNGTFASGSDIAASTNNTLEIALGDMDGDGDLDMVAGNYGSQVNRVYLGNGNGTFAAGNDIAATANNTITLIVGDLDGDGDLDVITGNDNQVNRIYLGNGDGTFASGSDVDTPTNTTEGLALGDLDADGDLDLVTGNYTQVNRVYLGNGNGTFASGNDVDTPTNTTLEIALGDVDGDGDLDLVVGNSTETNRIYLGNGNGTFASGNAVDTPTNQTRDLALGDLDGDGDLDIATGNAAQVNRVYLNSLALAVSSTSPAAAFANAPSTGNVSATFSAAVTAGGASSFVVQGTMTGTFSGAYSGNNTTTLVFNPTNDFFPGETVFSTLTTTVQNASGAKLTKGYVWQFTADAAVGPAVFINVSHDVDTPTNSTLAAPLGDLDGDGDLDLLAGNSTEVNRVYLGNGDGTFAAGSDVDTPTNSTQAAVLGDLDGDGDLDLVTGNYTEVNRVYLSNGNGTFATGNDVDTPTNNTFSAKLGDLDGDGDLDLVTGNGNQVNRVYLGNGNGTFATGSDVDTPTNDTRSVSLGDVDGDGDLDLIAGNQAQVNRVYLGNGNGTFASGSDVDTPTNNAQETQLGDLDADGDLDLVVGNSSQVNRVYLSNGNGTFATGNDIDTPADQTFSVPLGDVDGDGDLDLVTGNSGAVNRLYRGNGNGTFAAGVSIDTPTNQTRFVSLGDLDADGDLDIVTGNLGEVNRVYLNAALPTVSSTSPTAAFSSAQTSANVSATFSSAATGNSAATFKVFGSLTGEKGGAHSGNNTTTLSFDPSGGFRPGEEVEAVLTTGIQVNNSSLAKPYVWRFRVRTLANYSPVFSSAQTALFGSGSDRSTSLVFGDVDGDGDFDLAVGNNVSEQNVAYLNDGSGNFSTTKNIGTGDSSGEIALGDLDGDGDLDAAVGNVSSGQNTTHLNDGAGNFAAGVNYGTGSDNSAALALGDLDGDGDLDAAVGNHTSQQNVAYFNNGSGSLTASSANFGTGSEYALSVGLGDVDNDGDLDIAVGSGAVGSGEQNVVYLNDGSGSFATGTKNFGTGSDQTRSVALGDVENDGDLDIAVGNYLQQNVVYLNDGSGNFSTGNNFDANGSRSEDVIWADVDGDNDLDLAIGSDASSASLLAINDGSGGFATTINIGDASASTQDIALADVDGDGDLDAALGNSSQQNVLYENIGGAGLSETQVASGLTGVQTAAPSAEKQLFHIGVTGDGTSSVDSLRLTLSDLSTPTGLTAADISSLRVYRSNDATFDQGDALLATQNTVNIGSTTTLSFAADVVPNATQRFYIVVAKIAANPTDGHAFRVGFAAGGVYTSSGAIGTAVTASDANIMTVSVTATKLAFATQPSGSIGGAALTTQPVVQAQDASGNLDVDYSGTVALTTTAAGVLSNATAALSGGVATFSGLSYAATIDSQSVTLTASSSGLTSATSAAFIADVVATKLVLVTQPAGAVHGTALTTQPVVQAQNASGVLDLNMSGTVTLAASAGSVTNATAAMSGGVATFGSLAMNGVSAAKTLTASFSVSGVTSATSSSVAVTIAPVAFTFDNSSLSKTYDGQLKPLSVTTSPTGVSYSVTYNGSATAPSDPGTYSVVVTSTDANYTGSTTVQLIINGPPAPVAKLSATPTTGPVPLTVQFTSTSTGTFSGSTLATGQDGAQLGGFSSGAVTYTKPGTFTAVLTVSGPGGSSQASVTVTVLGPPTLGVIGAVSAKEDEVLTLNLSGKDSGAGSWSVSGLDNALIVSATVSGENIVFTPVKDKFGSDVVTVTRTSSLGLKTSQDVILTWTAVDDPPKIVNLSSTSSALEDVALTVGGTGHVVDIDSDMSKFVWSASGYKPELVASAIGGNGGVVFTPHKDKFGQTPVKLTVKDPVSGLEVAQDVTLTWMPVNDPPEKPVIAKPLDKAIDRPLSTILSWSAIDVDKDPLKFDVFMGVVGQPQKQVADKQTATTYSAVGLGPDTEYSWRVVARDPSDATAETTASFKTEADKIPPKISMLSATAVNDGIRIVWETDEKAEFILDYTSVPADPALAAEVGQVTNGTAVPAQKFEVALTKLQPATWYDFSVRVRDRFNNESPAATSRFRTLAAPDIIAPVITPGSIQVNGITEGGGWVRWSTDELSIGTVAYFRVNTAAAKLAQVVDGTQSGELKEQTLTRDHAVRLSGLRTASRYRLVISALDASNNLSIPIEQHFTTAAKADLVDPQFTEGPAARPQLVKAEIELKADEVVQVEVRYDTDMTPADGRVVSGGDPAENHQITLGALLPGTIYSYQVAITDVGANTTTSEILTFETRAVADLTAATAEGWQVVPSAESALLDFAFDELVTARVLWWPAADLTAVFFADIGNAALTHKLTLGNLLPATDYVYEIAATDEGKNLSSPIGGAFTTKAEPDILNPVIVSALVDAKTLEGTVLLVDVNELATLQGTSTLTGLPKDVTVAGAAVGDSKSIGSALKKSHSVALTQLVPGGNYRVDYVVTDPYTNASSGQLTFKAPLLPDTEPPKLKQLPSILSVSDVGVRLGVEYNENVQLKVRYFPTAVATAAETRNFTQRQPQHEFELNGLKSGREYTAELEASDVAQLVNKQTISFTTLLQPDLISPIFTQLPYLENAQLTSVRLKFEADEPVVATLQLTSSDNPPKVFSANAIQKSTSHGMEISGLSPGVEYQYQLTVKDAKLNETSVQGVVRTIDQIVPPAIVEGPTKQKIADDRAWIKLKTNIPARVEVDYALESSPVDIQSEKPKGLGKAHVVQLTNLLPDTPYRYTVRAIDDKSKSESQPISGTFRTAKVPDIIPPQIQGPPSVTAIFDRRAKIVWQTDEPADSKVVGTGPKGGKINAANSAQTLVHAIELTNLQPASTYTYSVSSTDLSSNSTTSAQYSFTTLALPDILPPVFTQNPIFRSVSHDNVVIAYSANELSTSTVEVGTTSNYELPKNAIGTAATDHEIQINGLAAGTEYHFRVSISDALNNGPTVFPDFVVTTDAQPDMVPPVILTGPLAITTTENKAILEWTTDEPADRHVKFWKKNNPGEGGEVEQGERVLAHQLVLNNLESGTVYEYEVSSSDKEANGPSKSAVNEFRTKDTPQLPAITAGPVAEVDESSATITWTTNVPSNSIVDLGVDTQYGTHKEQKDLELAHKVVIQNLSPGVLYHFKVSSIDLSNNTVTSDPNGGKLHSADWTVRTLGQADGQAPRLIADPIAKWTNTTVVISWETDEASTSRIEWQNLKTGEVGFVDDNQRVFQHNSTLTGLLPRTLYAIKVVSEDAAGNKMVWQPSAVAKAAAKMAYDRGLRNLASGKVAQPPGGAGTFVTDSFPDTRLPVITAGPRVREKTTESATIEWQTDELADSFVRFGVQENALQEVVGAGQDVQLHSITLTNLTPSTSYFFKVESTDPSGNGATESGIAVATTAAGVDLSPPRYVREPKVVATTDRQATIEWLGDEAASATIEYRSQGSDVLVRQVRERLLEQQVSLTNLAANTEYQALIQLRDANSNQTERPFELRFVTDAQPDLVPPRFLSEPRIKVLGDRSVIIVWETDELSSSFVDFDMSPYLGQVVGDPTYTTQHEIRLTNLEPDSTYFFRAGSTDRAQNGPIESPVASFRTLSQPDTEPPAVPSAVRTVAGPGAVLLEWDAVSASDLGGYTVYREDLRRRFVAVATGLTQPSYLDVGLTNSRTYRYRVSASDAQAPANESASSTIVTARPSADAMGAAPQIVGLEQGAEAGKPVVMIANAVPLDMAAQLSYSVQVSSRSDFATMVDRSGNILESPSGTTRWRLTRSLDPQTSYWFRARVFDGRFEGAWSTAQELRPIDAATATNSEDFDGDGSVGFRDFFIMANGFGSSDAVLDLDQGGSVGGEDFDRFKEHFGEVMPAKRLETQRVAVAQGSRVEVEAEAISANRVVVRLKLAGVKDLSGYGFSIAADPPILRYMGRVDSALFGGRGASLELAHEGDALAIGEHLRGRQAALDMSEGWEIALLFAIEGAPRNIELRVEEGYLGTGRGRMLRVEQEGSARIIPQVYALYANYPNPFNPSTVIPLAIPEWAAGRRGQKAALTLYNALGQVVRTWDLSGWSPGFYSLRWDGRNAQGHAAASGVYLMRLRAGDFIQVRKALLLR